MGSIFLGLWEHGAEAWYKLHDWHRSEGLSAAGLAAATKRRRMQQVLRGHEPQKAAAGQASSAHRVIPGLLKALYASESSGSLDSVHRDSGRNWYIHRCYETSIVYLVPALRAKDEYDVRSLVGKMRGHKTESPYKHALSEGLLIVQDERPGRVQVKRGGVWEPATEPEVFAYYDFLLRYPQPSHSYHSEKRAREFDEELSKSGATEILKSNLHLLWTTFPSAYVSDQNEAPALTMSRNGTYIFTGSFYDPIRKKPDRISDWAWRLPR